MRKTTLRFSSSVAKSGCGIAHAPAPSLPVMVKSACTPPSGEPSRLRTNLASRTGPFALMNNGTPSPRPCVANRNCGLSDGLEPPSAGCE